MHPFLDLKNIPDDQLLDRLNKARTYLHFQSSMGHLPTVHSISDVINSLEEEIRERNYKRIHEGKHPENIKSHIELGNIDNL